MRGGGGAKRALGRSPGRARAHSGFFFFLSFFRLDLGIRRPRPLRAVGGTITVGKWSLGPGLFFFSSLCVAICKGTERGPFRNS